MQLSLGSRLCAVLVLTATTIVLGACGGASTPPASIEQQNSLPTTVDMVVETAMQQQNIPGMTVALAKNGVVLYEQGYGFSDLATHQAAQPSLIFEIGSITKQFTAALIMLLQEQGRLHVDDSVAIYLPQYNFPAAITLRMMLTHTSGLADFTDFPQLADWLTHGVSEETVLMAVAQMPLQFQPGSQYAYSNSNFFALGAIIETLTGQTFAANLGQAILQPLGLMHTYYLLPPANLAATGYTDDGSGLVPAVLWDRSAAFAAGALSSNINDLVAWDDALFNGRVVSAASFEAMTTSNGFPLPGGGSYGFGLALSVVNNRRLIWHNGQIGGFTAENAVFLDSGFAVIVLTNDQNADTDSVVLKLIAAVCNSAQLSQTCN